jgi:hypothetical protein
MHAEHESQLQTYTGMYVVVQTNIIRHRARDVAADVTNMLCVTAAGIVPLLGDDDTSQVASLATASGPERRHSVWHQMAPEVA